METLGFITAGISAITFFGGLIYLIARYGILNFVSDYYFALLNDKLGIYFTVWMGVIATSTLYPLTVISPSWLDYFAVPCCLLLHFVAASPNTKIERFMAWHKWGAIGSAVCATVIAVALGYAGLLFISQGVAFLIASLHRKENETPKWGYWAEVAGFVMIYAIMFKELL